MTILSTALTLGSVASSTESDTNYYLKQALVSRGYLSEIEAKNVYRITDKGHRVLRKLVEIYDKNN